MIIKLSLLLREELDLRFLMSDNFLNVGKIIHEIVSAEAWHDTIQYNDDTGLFIAVAFKEGRFQGGEKFDV